MGILLAEVGKSDEAETAFQEAVELRKKLAGDFPTILRYRQELARTYNDQGFMLRRQMKYGEAEKVYHQAVGLWEKLVAEPGAAPAHRQKLASGYVGLAEVLREQKKEAEAEKVFRQALPHQTRLTSDFPNVADYRNDLVNTLVNLALLHQQRHEMADSVPLLEQARTHLRAALAVSPKNRVSRRFYRDNLRILAKSYLSLNDHRQLATTADDLAQFSHEPVNDTYDSACMLSRCVTMAEKDAGLIDARRKEMARSYAEQALARLRQAVDRGFKDADRMKHDAHLEPLRGRAEFEKLVAEVEGKRKEKFEG
jgi:tetratricopeptide (TPR) repeat protein